jgi:hypothetical protein
MRWFVRLGLLICVSAAVCGCSENSYDSVPVTGTVQYKGAPVEGATVAFHGGNAKVPGTAITDAAGKFKLTSYKQGDGVPAGSYKVTVAKLKLEGAASTGPQSMEDAMKSKPSGAKESNSLPAKYASQESTPLTATVEKGKANDIALTLTD